MIKGLGVDIVDLRRMARWLSRFDRATLALVFTSRELDLCDGPTPERRLGVCFGGKEAVGKALGTGLSGIDWREIEIDVRPAGAGIALSGAALRVAEARGVSSWLATWSCQGARAMVVAVAE
jgi:holo-[acyl-carrier protein] synthase